MNRRVEGNTIYPFGNISNSVALQDLWQDEGKKVSRRNQPAKDRQDNRKPLMQIVFRKGKKPESSEE